MKHFIHIPKNGGMTVRHGTLDRKTKKRSIELSSKETLPINYYNTMVSVMKQNGEHPGTEHARWRDLKPEYRNDCFAFIRNPWSRVVSRYTFLLHTQDVGRGKSKSYKKMSFYEFLEERNVYGNKPFYWHRAIRGWFNQKDYVTDEKGNLKVDCLRTEYLYSDWRCYFGTELNMHKRNVSKGRTGNVNTDMKDYKDFYNNKTLQIIADWYKDDIDYFGFDFDTPATRNINV